MQSAIIQDFYGRTWLVRQWLLPRTCTSTNSVLNVYLVIKIIKVHKLQVSEKCIQAIELNRTGTLPPTEIFLTSRKR